VALGDIIAATEAPQVKQFARMQQQISRVALELKKGDSNAR